MALNPKIIALTTTDKQPAQPENHAKLLIFPGKVAHLAYLDGLRGVVALYVVIFHSFFFQSGLAPGLLPEDPTITNRLYQLIHLGDYLFEYGHLAVVIFIVLSGYSLMLEPVHSKHKWLKGGVKGYLRRRARRILPPYYAALGLSLLAIGLVPGMNQPSELTGNIIEWHNTELGAFTPAAIFSHLVLVHNWFLDTHVAINSPMWSIGLEWQLYFLLAFAFLPLWRKFGTPVLFWTGLIIALSAHFLTFEALYYSYPGFIGIFALGMFGAAVSFSPQPAEREWRERFNWKLLAVVGGLLFGLLRVFEVAYRLHFPVLQEVWPRLGKGRIDWFQDTVIALIVVSLLIHFSPARTLAPGVEPWLIRTLKSNWLTRLGKFSYNLYLTHAPLLVLLGLMCANFHLAPALASLLVLVLGVPLCVGVAYLFHLIFERPFLSKK